MFTYEVSVKEPCNISVEESSNRNILGLRGISKVIVSRETSETTRAPLLPGTSTPELFWFQDRACLHQYLNRSSRFLRNALAVVNVEGERESVSRASVDTLTPSLLSAAQEFDFEAEERFDADEANDVEQMSEAEEESDSDIEEANDAEQMSEAEEPSDILEENDFRALNQEFEEAYAAYFDEYMRANNEQGLDDPNTAEEERILNLSTIAEENETAAAIEDVSARLLMGIVEQAVDAQLSAMFEPVEEEVEEEDLADAEQMMDAQIPTALESLEEGEEVVVERAVEAQLPAMFESVEEEVEEEDLADAEQMMDAQISTALELLEEGEEVVVEQMIDSHIPVTFEAIAEGVDEEAAAVEDEIDESLLGAVGGIASPFDVQPRGALGAIPKSRPSGKILNKPRAEAVDPLIVYSKPSKVKEACAEALLFYSDLKGIILSETKKSNITTVIITSANTRSLEEALKHILLHNRVRLNLVQSEPTKSTIDVVADVEICEEEEHRTRMQIVAERNEWAREENRPITEREIYRENHFLAQLLLTPKDSWLEREDFVELIKLISFEKNIDFSSYVHTEVDKMLGSELVDTLDDAEALEEHNLNKRAEARIARRIYEWVEQAHIVVPEEFRSSFNIDSLTQMLDDYPRMDALPFASEADERNPRAAKVKYNHSLHFWLQAIERLNCMKESRDIDEVLAVIMKTASLSVKRDREYVGQYRAGLNIANSESPVPDFTPPKRVNFEPKVTYLEVVREDLPTEEPYTCLHVVREEARDIFFGLERERERYYAALNMQNLEMARQRLLNIADYYDGMNNTDFLARVRRLEIITLEDLELEVANYMTL